MTGVADVDGFELFIQVCVWPCFPPLVNINLMVTVTETGMEAVHVIGPFERSQNTVLLASTQAVYKSPHSTVCDAFLTCIRQSVEPRTADQPVGSLRA